ncbi:Nitrogen regulation protein NR(I) [Planctomycetes bacterium Pan216]|uniref:DNA-binding transcriptional regulator NtrC n=1 Tax=Kolteria novifilia TaxID=2527975 RepID=A0A518B4U5_9BACT|nr:Nitrogen regulation protein NR(I) [Planctomycetes bacterium Pan216]
MPKVLAIDDDRSVLHMITRAFDNSDTAVITARDGSSGLDLVGSVQPDVLLLDIMLPDSSGLELFERFRRADPKLPIIFITAKGDSATAIEAMKVGAFDYLRKPLDIRQLRELVDRAAEVRRLMHVPIQMEDSQADPDADTLVGESPSMLEVYKLIGQAAPQNISVLIRGESGTGKELVARAIYHFSQRASLPFLPINCAAIPESLLESELFGHEKGAFTGADAKRIGKFEQCSGGTIFLDEIGDMPITLQSKILRLLQDQTFERVGGRETIKTDVRIIAATNRNLEEMIEEGDFREDLYYRLNGITVSLPPLRERGDDVGVLLNHFLWRFAKEFGRDIKAFSEDALKRLKSHSWPGNIRELQSVLKRSMLRAKGQILLEEFLPPEVLSSHDTDEDSASSPSGLPPSDIGPLVERRLAEDSESLYAEAVEALDAYVVSRVLQATNGNQSQTARILGITRGNLRKKIAIAGISIDRIISLEEG